MGFNDSNTRLSKSFSQFPTSLPSELILEILLYLDAPNLTSLRLVSQMSTSCSLGPAPRQWLYHRCSTLIQTCHAFFHFVSDVGRLRFIVDCHRAHVIPVRRYSALGRPGVSVDSSAEDCQRVRRQTRQWRALNLDSPGTVSCSTRAAQPIFYHFNDGVLVVGRGSRIWTYWLSSSFPANRSGNTRWIEEHHTLPPDFIISSVKVFPCLDMIVAASLCVDPSSFLTSLGV